MEVELGHVLDHLQVCISLQYFRRKGFVTPVDVKLGLYTDYAAVLLLDNKCLLSKASILVPTFLTIENVMNPQ